ncbi:hypothetical protein MGN70_003232 [Eutypa lata]|nr:hypothetical protein MGN70_003232 [Eutypa lata]
MEDSICTYAKQRLAANHHRLAQHGLCGEDLDNMSNRIAQKADGMFLWARLVLDYLATNIFLSRSEIVAAVDILPRELSKL